MGDWQGITERNEHDIIAMRGEQRTMEAAITNLAVILNDHVKNSKERHDAVMQKQQELEVKISEVMMKQIECGTTITSARVGLKVLLWVGGAAAAALSAALVILQLVKHLKP